MPTITWTIAKGIPSRSHLPPKPKKQNNCKRQAGDSSDDESKPEGSELDDPTPKAKANKHKWPRKVMVESEEEVESVDDTTKPGKDAEEVDDEPGNEVSTNPQWHGIDSHNHRMTVLTSTNMVKSSKKNPWKKIWHRIFLW